MSTITYDFVFKLIQDEDGKGYFQFSFPILSSWGIYPNMEVKVPISQEHIDWIKNLNTAIKS